MVRNNRGSALIIVLIIMSFIMVFAVSTVTVTYSEEITSKSSNDSNNAFYIAEAGVERAVNIIKAEEDLQSYIDDKLSGLTANTPDTTIKSNIVNAVSTYCSTFFPSNPPDMSNPKSTIKYKYQYYLAGSSGKEITNGIDTQKFSLLNDVPCYYNITVTPASSPAPSFVSGVFTEYINIASTGHYGNSVRTINAVYKVQYLKGVIQATTTTVPTSDPNLDMYFSTSLSLISPAQNGVLQFHQGFTINGDIMLYNMGTDSKNKQANLTGNLYYNPTKPSNISPNVPYQATKVNTSYTIEPINFSKIPQNHDNIVYITKNSKSNYLDTSEVADRTKTYVILCSGDLTIDKKMEFTGVIYCQGKVKLSGNGQGLTLTGTIIATGLEGKNHITINKLDSTVSSSIKSDINSNIHQSTIITEDILKFKDYNINPESWNE